MVQSIVQMVNPLRSLLYMPSGQRFFHLGKIVFYSLKITTIEPWNSITAIER